jgi:hypothetical protein
MNRWLWVLWGAMIVSMLLKRQADPYMLVALIILPILIVLLDLHEEIVTLKEENKHQRKFVMDRYNLLQEKMKDMSTQIEKRLVVDFAEFAKNNPVSEEETSGITLSRAERNQPSRRKKRRKKKKPETISNPPVDFSDLNSERISQTAEPPVEEDDFEDI